MIAVNQGFRAEFRDTIATILKERVLGVSGRVYRARVWPVGGDKKPGLLVYGYAEIKQKLNEDIWRHEFDVACNMVVKVLCEGAFGMDAVVTLETQCETIAQQVERVILSAPELWGSTGLPEKLPKITTQISADQKERAVEIEALMQFEVHWREIFEMAEPDTSECADTEVRISDPSIPTA